jgi:hypothetical protein
MCGNTIESSFPTRMTGRPHPETHHSAYILSLRPEFLQHRMGTSSFLSFMQNRAPHRLAPNSLPSEASSLSLPLGRVEVFVMQRFCPFQNMPIGSDRTYSSASSMPMNKPPKSPMYSHLSRWLHQRTSTRSESPRQCGKERNPIRQIPPHPEQTPGAESMPLEGLTGWSFRIRCFPLEIPSPVPIRISWAKPSLTCECHNTISLG